jgi:hypothetical protein
VAIAAAGDRRLRRVEPEDFSIVPGAAHRPPLTSGSFINTRPSPRLHTLLAQLQPADAKPGLSITQTAKPLDSLRPLTTVDVERKQTTEQLLED